MDCKHNFELPSMQRWQCLIHNDTLQTKMYRRVVVKEWACFLFELDKQDIEFKGIKQIEMLPWLLIITLAVYPCLVLNYDFIACGISKNSNFIKPSLFLGFSKEYIKFGQAFWPSTVNIKITKEFYLVYKRYAKSFIGNCVKIPRWKYCLIAYWEFFLKSSF